MLKRISIIAAALLFALAVTAQDTDSESNGENGDQDQNSSFRGSTQLVQAGISLGYYGYGYLGSRTGFSLPISVAYERALKNNFSAGAFIGYASYKYKYLDYKFGWTYLDFGGRISYHYLPLVNEFLDEDYDTDKFDLYISLMLIFESRTYSTNNDYLTGQYDNEFRTLLGTVAGFRYHFNDKFSVFFEGGRSTFGYATVGLTAYF